MEVEEGPLPARVTLAWEGSQQGHLCANVLYSFSKWLSSNYHFQVNKERLEHLVVQESKGFKQQQQKQ